MALTTSTSARVLERDVPACNRTMRSFTMDIRSTPDNTIASPTTSVLRRRDERQFAPAQRDAHSEDVPRTPVSVSAVEALALCMETGCCGV